MRVDKAGGNQPVTAIDAAIRDFGAFVTSDTGLDDIMIANEDVAPINDGAFGIEREDQRIVEQGEAHDMPSHAFGVREGRGSQAAWRPTKS